MGPLREEKRLLTCKLDFYTRNVSEREGERERDIMTGLRRKNKVGEKKTEVTGSLTLTPVSFQLSKNYSFYAKRLLMDDGGHVITSKLMVNFLLKIVY